MINKFLRVLLILIVTAGTAHALDDGVTVPLVADSSTADGEQGILLFARVIAMNGTGHVFVDTSPYTQVDLQGSARLAAMVASDVLGIDQRAYDFYYIIDISSPIIGGPSAGGALTVATIAAVNNWTLKPGVVMTGMINPDDSIGPVGGIPYKLEAAAAENYTLFLVPEGQGTVTLTKLITRAKGNSIITRDVEETIDVMKLGKDLNVTVREVSTIQEVVKIFTGHEIKRPVFNGTILTPGYMGLLEPLATNLKTEASDMYNETAALTPQSPYLKDAKDILGRADKMYDTQKYYAATSLYFNSMINIRAARWIYEYGNAPDKDQYIAELADVVETQINQSESDLDVFKSDGVFDVGAVGAAESRITTSKLKLEETKKLNNSEEKIYGFAFANERARTAQWWLTLSTQSGKVVPEKILKDRAGWYLSQGQSINTYMQELLSQSAHPGVIGSPVEDLIHAQKEMQRGYYSGAVFDSLQGSVKSSTIIGFMGLLDATGKVNKSEGDAKDAINEARMAGIEPTLAVSAYEYAQTMPDPYEKINQFTYAKMVAKTLIVLNSHAVPSDKIPVKPVLTPFAPQATSSTPVPPPLAAEKTPAAGVVAVLIVMLVSRRIYKN
ncbi:MAG: S16 family serine protease [Candidatus Methanoperedens sp.]|nr:S16 family serine protease [Candidatus Methanoperedens sp.]